MTHRTKTVVCAAVHAIALGAYPANLRGIESASSAGSATVEFLYVGLGAAVLIRSPEGKTALIDAGPHEDVVKHLRTRGVTKIDLAILTHRHIDHYGGMDDVIKEFPVTDLIENGSTIYKSRSYDRLMAMVARAGIRVSQPTQEPREIALGTVRLTILPHPPFSYFGIDLHSPEVRREMVEVGLGTSTENDRSIGVRVQYGDVSFLLTGDSNALERRWWMDHPEASRLCANATILKIPFKGSRSSIDAAWLDLVRPQSAVVSTGFEALQKGWNMPSQEVLELLRARGIRLQNTALSGPVGYRTDGVSWEVFFDRPKSGLPASGSVRPYAAWQYLVAVAYLTALAWGLWRRRAAWYGLPPRPFLVLPLGLLVLILYGFVGLSFGIPTLFWHDWPPTQAVAGLSVMGLAVLLARLARASAGRNRAAIEGAAKSQADGPDPRPRAWRPWAPMLGRVEPVVARRMAADRAVGVPLILVALPPALLPALRGERISPSLDDGLMHLWLPIGLALGLFAANTGACLSSRLWTRLGSLGQRGWVAVCAAGALALGGAALAWRAKVTPPAAASLCFLLALFGLVAYSTGGRPVRRYAIAAALLLWVAYANGRDPYKLVFPHLDAYYRPGAQVDISYHRGMKEGRRGTAGREDLAPGHVELVSDVDALNRWKAAQREDVSKQTLVVVSVSGGGITAAVWTAECLERLVNTIPKFARRVRLITGASGGMVGAAHFTASIDAPPPPPPPTPEPSGTEPEDEDDDDDELYKQSEPHPFGAKRPDLINDLSRDCLTPVASHLVLIDLPSVLWPGRVSVDRGQVLERALERNTDGALAVPFSSLAAGEAEGWRPSLVVTPMLVEEGRPMIISNLNLGYLDEIEFFRLFPNARDFRLSTALRMNAAFPYVTPATNLPTDPPRRVVDAGYFDNYGVRTACAWIEKNQDWLLENTAGIVLIQIRAYPMTDAEAENGLATYFARGLQWATSPLEGYTAAKQQSMIERNSSLIARLQDSFQRRTPNQLFFSTVVFESYADAALSWTMTQADRRKLSVALNSTENALALERVQLLLRAKSRGIGRIED
jgi:beta-lactamase superfamily II metal-dependent hydrolase